MIADIFSGEVDAADVFFLIATLLAVAAAFLYAARRPDTVVWAPVAGWLGAACAFFGFLLL